MSGDPDQEYFSDGISEDVLNLLAQVPELTVISRSSAFSFKNRGIAIAEVAEQLNVAHVLEGSVRKVGNRVRITAQLIEASSDSHLWSESYDRELEDIFAVQDEIAAAISDALKIELSLEQPAAIKADNTDAYGTYLRARALINGRGPDNVKEAVSHLERSIRLENDFAPAHAQLAIANTLLFTYGEFPLEIATMIAVPHLDRAQELEPDLAEAHAGRALLALSVDAESAAENAQKALAANPNYADAIYWLFLSQLSLGQYAEANATLEQLLVKDPLSVVGRQAYANLLSQTGRVDEAHELADQFLAEDRRLGYQLHAEISLIRQGEMADGLSWALQGNDVEQNGVTAFMRVGLNDEVLRISHMQSVWIDLIEKRFDRVVELAQRFLQRMPDDRQTIWMAAEIMYEAGRIDQAHPLYERLGDFVAEGRPIPSSIIDHRSDNEMMLRLAHARRIIGDEKGAKAAAAIAKQDHEALGAAGVNNQFQFRTEAMIAAFEKDLDRVVTAGKSAIQNGLRYRQFLDDAIFEIYWKEPRFDAVREELDAVIAAERDKVLQLICFNNPAPDNWQPMPETCEGVVEKLLL
jgi:TolB-like protein